MDLGLVTTWYEVMVYKVEIETLIAMHWLNADLTKVYLLSIVGS